VGRKLVVIAKVKKIKRGIKISATYRRYNKSLMKLWPKSDSVNVNSRALTLSLTLLILMESMCSFVYEESMVLE